ncbi:Putative ribonuclease H protein At1g65750 [Linum perenne]
MNNRLAGWKAENLSLAGRVTLATSVLNSLPCFIMQTAFLPVSLCDKIDRIIRNFIWGTEGGVRRVHNVNWETVCKPKHLGGLGLRSAKNGIHWSIRNGRSTRFWTDRWVDSGTILIDHATNLQGVDSTIPVSDFCLSNGEWNLPKLREFLPENVVWQVYGMSPPRADMGEDTRVWGLENNGRFTVKSAYLMLKDLDSGGDSSSWRTIWSWNGPNKIRHFMWLVSHGKLMTNVERTKRRFTDDEECGHCQSGREYIDHVLRSCSFACQVWSKVLPYAILQDQAN